MSLSPRLVAIQGIGFSPIYVAVQGLLDYIEAGGETDRRPKSTNTLRLQRIKEGKAWLVSSKSATRARTVTAKGYIPEVVVLPVSPGRATALSGSCKSVSRKVLSQGTSRTTALRSVADTCSWQVQARGASRTPVLHSMSDTAASSVAASGGAGAGVLTSTCVSASERVRARGVRSLSDAETIVVTRMLTARGNVVY